jgi:ribonuclease HI
VREVRELLAETMLIAHFDGCCEPRNPGGHAAWGAILLRDNEVIWQDKGYCGVGPKMSNNVAEYSGICAVLARLHQEQEICLIRGDSKLVIMQLQHKWKINGGLYIPYYAKAATLYQPIKNRIKFEWIPRDQNGVCDVLSKAVLKDMGVKFRIQPEAA